VHRFTECGLFVGDSGSNRTWPQHLLHQVSAQSLRKVFQFEMVVPLFSYGYFHSKPKVLGAF
jgi:hypothetical protein